MFVQTFSWFDIPLIFLILILELLLAADNAALLSLIVKNLPPHQKKSALFVGAFSAVFLRLLGVVFAFALIYFFWTQIIGGAYLLYVAWQFLFSRRHQGLSFTPTSYWKAVGMIELMDLLFAVDSILAAFALASLYYPFITLSSKLWVIYLGGLLGVFAVRAVTTQLIRLLDKHKHIEQAIFYLVGWMGLKLIAHGIFPPSYTLDLIFWVGAIVVLVIGLLKWPKKV